MAASFPKLPKGTALAGPKVGSNPGGLMAPPAGKASASGAAKKGPVNVGGLKAPPGGKGSAGGTAKKPAATGAGLPAATMINPTKITKL